MCSPRLKKYFAVFVFFSPWVVWKLQASRHQPLSTHLLKIRTFSSITTIPLLYLEKLIVIPWCHLISEPYSSFPTCAKNVFCSCVCGCVCRDQASQPVEWPTFWICLLFSHGLFKLFLCAPCKLISCFITAFSLDYWRHWAPSLCLFAIQASSSVNSLFIFCVPFSIGLSVFFLMIFRSLYIFWTFVDYKWNLHFAQATQIIQTPSGFWTTAENPFYRRSHHRILLFNLE